MSSPFELEKRLPRVETRAEKARGFLVVAIALPTLAFLLSFLWALTRP